jgi:cobalt-zinc-cadmium efflux system protein
VAHDHAAHSHAARADADRGRLAVALSLILAFIAVEVSTAVIAHSLALLSDAAHMVTDAAAIGFSLIALRLAARPARGAMTFGFRRVEILSAQANGVTLLVLAAFIAYEAIRRLFDPPVVRRQTARASTWRAPSSICSPTSTVSSARRSRPA